MKTLYEDSSVKVGAKVIILSSRYTRSFAGRTGTLVSKGFDLVGVQFDKGAPKSKYFSKTDVAVLER